MKEKLRKIMKEDKETKKRLGVIIISLVLMIGLVIGLTYAAFTYTSSGTQENIVSTTAVTMKYTEKTNGILLDNAMPTSDEVGKTLALDSNYAFYFTVSITTGSNTPIGYEVTAEKLTAKELFDNKLTDEDKEADVELVKDDEVRLYLERSENNPDNYQSIMEPTIYTPLTTATPLGAQVGEMMLDFGTVSETKTYHYILRMWVGENYNVDDIERYYGVRVNVYGTDSRAYSNTLTLNKNSLELEIDETEQLTTTVSPTNVTNADITWSSSDSTIATVDTMGNVTGVKAGTATITATTSKGRKATCIVTIKGKSPTAISGIEVDGSSLGDLDLTLTTDTEKVVGVNITPNDYDDSTYSVTWTTSDSDIVDIEEVTEGTTGTSNENETIIASKMASKNITAKKVKLKASNTPGEATVTATIKNKNGEDITKSFDVKVQYPDLESITLDKSSATIDVNGTVDIKATIGPDKVNNSKLYWASSDTSIATINCSETNTIETTCTVTGVSSGVASETKSAVITITDNNGHTETSIITIQNPEITAIDISSDVSTNVRHTAVYTIGITPSNVRNQSSIVWESSDTTVAKIPNECAGAFSCSVNAVGVGNATITARVNNTAISDKANIIVASRDTSGANVPELRGTMVPVIYDETNNTWVKADEDDWYDYDSLEWANAVTLTSAARTNNTYNVGDPIPESAINSYFVWIPRYSYTLQGSYGHTLDETGSTPSSLTPGAFDIKFISNNTTDSGTGTYTGATATNYFTPPGFTFDSHNLSGVWISKFDLSGSTVNPTSKPGLDSRMNLSPKDLYNTIKIYMNGNNGSSIYGFSGNYDTHMSKNSEWSLMSYLSQSKYGKYGNPNYSGANKEIYKNNSSDYITGCSSGEPSKADDGTAGCTNTYATSAGQGASTTGNIYGIYDTSGGSWEYVMTAVETKSSGFSTSEFTALSPIYLDILTSYTISEACGGRACRGQNLNTTVGWYGDYTDYPTPTWPWLGRGGDVISNERTGIFGFTHHDGASHELVSTRIILSTW